MNSYADALRTVIQGKQRNHGDFHLPEAIRHLGDMPLYRAVAWWGLHLGRAFTRDDVSLAFQIEPRRASGILNYISHRHVGDGIAFEAHRHAVRGARGMLALHILAVSDDAAPSRRALQLRPAPEAGNLTKEQDRQMARWLLSRPVAGDALRLEAWKAACPVKAATC